MFSSSKEEIKETNIEIVKKQLEEAREKVTAQERSNELMKENVRRGGSGGFIPPYMSQHILDHYKKEVRDLEAHLKNLENNKTNGDVNSPSIK